MAKQKKFTEANGRYLASKINKMMDNKQDTLVSGDNIKTINGESLLGNGNLTINRGGSEYCDTKSINIESFPFTIDVETVLDGKKYVNCAFINQTGTIGEFNITGTTYNATVKAYYGGQAVNLNQSSYVGNVKEKKANNVFAEIIKYSNNLIICIYNNVTF